jgi:4'-phosphopantetheinyl transferase
MIKLYCLKIEHFEASFFSEMMSSKYNEESSKRRSSFAWRALEKIILKEFNIALNKDMIVFNKHGKPYLKNSHIYFNMSHSSNYVVIGLSDSEIGVDIEKLVSKDRSLQLINKLNQTFIDEFNISLDPQEFFTKCWVSIESYSKMIGKGLSVKRIKDYLRLNESIFKITNIETKEVFYFTAINKNNDKIDNVYYKI